MKINFSKKSKDYLADLKNFIAKDSLTNAKNYISKLIHKITKTLQYPNIGKINQVYNREDIREIFIDGHKVIYKINQKSVLILVVYKYIDFDEPSLF